MNKELYLRAIGLSIMVATSAKASVLFYDGFDYTAATNLEDSAAWGGANSGTAPIISAGSLSVSGLQSSTGQKVSFASGNIREAIGEIGSLVAVNSVFYSFAFQLSSLPTATTYSFALSTGGTNYGSVVWLQASGAGFVVGLSNRSSGATPVYDSTVHSLNTTIFLAGSYTFVSGAANDTSSLWINPSSGSFGSGTAPSATLNAAGGTDLAGVSQFLIRGASGSPGGLIDELRVGTSWADVTPAAVPEPGTYAAILGAVALVGVAARRRRA